jgi:hypothetical protein
VVLGYASSGPVAQRQSRGLLSRCLRLLIRDCATNLKVERRASSRPVPPRRVLLAVSLAVKAVRVPQGVPVHQKGLRARPVIQASRLSITYSREADLIGRRGTLEIEALPRVLPNWRRPSSVPQSASANQCARSSPPIRRRLGTPSGRPGGPCGVRDHSGCRLASSLLPRFAKRRTPSTVPSRTAGRPRKARLRHCSRFLRCFGFVRPKSRSNRSTSTSRQSPHASKAFGAGGSYTSVFGLVARRAARCRETRWYRLLSRCSG